MHMLRTIGNPRIMLCSGYGAFATGYTPFGRTRRFSTRNMKAVIRHDPESVPICLPKIHLKCIRPISVFVFRVGFSTKILCAFFILPISDTFPAHRSCLYFTVLTMLASHINHNISRQYVKPEIAHFIVFKIKYCAWRLSLNPSDSFQNKL